MQIIGHRGAKGLAPENTLAGIKFALKRHVDWVEFDVRMTKDNQAVVVHDATLRRLAHLRKKVRSFTLSELKEIALLSGETIPTLEEVIKTISRRAKVDIDLKEPAGAPQVVAAIKQQIAAGRTYQDFIVTSLYFRCLWRLQRLDKNIRLGYLQGKASWIWPLRFLTLPGLKLYAVGFYQTAAPWFAIQLAKKRGLWVIVWTVNHKAQAKRLEKHGVDAIITDRPQDFLPNWPLLLSISFTTVILILLVIGSVWWFFLRR